MTQLIPYVIKQYIHIYILINNSILKYSLNRFMKLHVNDKCNQSILIHIRERIIFLFKQKPYSSQVVHQFQTQFSESLDKAIEKYCGVT